MPDANTYMYSTYMHIRTVHRPNIGDFAATRSLWPKINHFCTVSQANECLTTLSLTFFTERNFVADFLQTKCDFTPKTAVLCFWGLGINVRWSS